MRLRFQLYGVPPEGALCVSRRIFECARLRGSLWGLEASTADLQQGVMRWALFRSLSLSNSTHFYSESINIDGLY